MIDILGTIALILAQALYDNREELLRTNFGVAPLPDAAPEHRWSIAFYCPADHESTSEETWPGLERYFAFADDGFGNGYLIDPRHADPAVLFHEHDTGELSRVCDRFTEFMTWPRFEAEAAEHPSGRSTDSDDAGRTR